VFENPRDKIHIARVDCTVVISPKHARPTAKEVFCPQLRKTNRYLDRNVNPKQVVRQLLIKEGVQEDTLERSTGDRRTSPSFEWPVEQRLVRSTAESGDFALKPYCIHVQRWQCGLRMEEGRGRIVAIQCRGVARPWQFSAG
jgi:hypothetical protein